MNRFALLIDAGYLLSGGGLLTVGTPIRAGLACSHRELVASLIEFAESHSKQELLRVYWYDGARDLIPTDEHNVVGALDNVKVRLGRLTQSGQKGVDSRIVRDLMTLARERAITTAFLLSGDEDLREGVADAQEVGVRVILLGIPAVSAKARNQAPSLVREADEHVVLAEEVWASHISLRKDLITVDVALEFLSDNSQNDSLREVGRLVAEAWVDRATMEEVYELADLHPRVPMGLDTDLLIAAQLALKGTIPRRSRPRLREGFWKELLSAVALFDATGDSDESELA
jgi:uncharacterized LabA/DUF88 family protein